LILTKGLIAISVEEDVKAYLVTREPSRWPGDVKVLYIPFVDEDVLYIFDEKRGFMEIRGRDRITEFIARLRNGM
jgi:hypothetical protein